MKNLIFVCHGNICRSPAAEWIMKYLIKQYQMEDRFSVISRAVSLEEIGNDIYPPMKRALNKANVPFETHHAKQITKQDYEWADFIFYMDDSNFRYLNYLTEDTDKKYIKITEYTKNPIDIDDPWYSGEYDIVINQIWESCELIIKKLK